MPRLERPYCVYYSTVPHRPPCHHNTWPPCPYVSTMLPLLLLTPPPTLFPCIHCLHSCTFQSGTGTDDPAAVDPASGGGIDPATGQPYPVASSSQGGLGPAAGGVGAGVAGAVATDMAMDGATGSNNANATKGGVRGGAGPLSKGAPSSSASKLGGSNPGRAAVGGGGNARK